MTDEQNDARRLSETIEIDREDFRFLVTKITNMSDLGSFRPMLLAFFVGLVTSTIVALVQTYPNIPSGLRITFAVGVTGGVVMLFVVEEQHTKRASSKREALDVVKLIYEKDRRNRLPTHRN